jgi:hypothetical protein
MRNYLNILILLFALSQSVSLIAQLNYKNGYIITLKNDTLFGLVNDGGGIKNSKMCLYKANKKSKAEKYYPKDIKSYRFIGDKYYSSREFFFNDGYNYVFADVLLEGKLNLYYFRKNKELEYYLEKDTCSIGLLNKKVVIPVSSEGLYGLQNSEMYSQVYSEEFRNRTNTSVYVDLYKDTLMSVFSDCRKIQQQVHNVEYNQKSMTKITKAYIKETCGKNDCINYEKDFSLKRSSFGIFSGVQFSRITWKPDVKSEFISSVPIGVFYNAPMALLNDRLSFQIEVISNNSTRSQEYSNNSDTIQYLAIKSSTLGIPLLLKYEISRRRVSPSFAVGKETAFVFNSKVIINENEDLLVNKSQKAGWFYEFGLNYKLSQKFSLFSNLRFQTNSNFIVPIRSQRVNYKDARENDLIILDYKTHFVTLFIGLKF